MHASLHDRIEQAADLGLRTLPPHLHAQFVAPSRALRAGWRAALDEWISFGPYDARRCGLRVGCELMRAGCDAHLCERAAAELTSALAAARSAGPGVGLERVAHHWSSAFRVVGPPVWQRLFAPSARLGLAHAANLVRVIDRLRVSCASGRVLGHLDHALSWLARHAPETECRDHARWLAAFDLSSAFEASTLPMGTRLVPRTIVGVDRVLEVEPGIYARLSDGNPAASRGGAIERGRRASRGRTAPSSAEADARELLRRPARFQIELPFDVHALAGTALSDGAELERRARSEWGRAAVTPPRLHTVETAGFGEWASRGGGVIELWLIPGLDLAVLAPRADATRETEPGRGSVEPDASRDDMRGGAQDRHA